MLFASVGIFIGFSQAEAQQARVYGQITEVDGSPVVGASISIENTTLGSSSDVEGRYELTGLDAGRYTLLFRSLGYEPEQQDISLDDAEQLELNVTLEPQEYAMQQVEVLGRRERSYKNNSTFSLSRTEMRVSELPQSVSFVTKELIEDQNAYRLNDVLGNIAGANTFSTYDDITIRGFRNSGNVRLLNGMRYVSNFWTSPLLVNIERVEVVKGPSSVTFGNASPGGTINLVTKKPLNRDRAALSFSFGSFNRLRTTADLTGPLGDEGRLLYRLNVGYEDSESFRDQMFYKTLAIAPSLSYVPNEGTRLNIDLSYYDNNTLLDRGRPTLRNDEDLLSVPVELNVAQPGDVLNPETFAATLSLNHQFSDRLDFNVNLSRFKEERVLKEHRTNNSYLSDSEIGLAYVHRTTQSVAENLSSFFTLRFETGALQHQVIAGADYARYDETRNQLSNGSVGSFDLLNPENRLRDISSYDLQPAFSDARTQYETFGGYLQNVLRWDRLQLMLGLRRDIYVVPESSRTNTASQDDRQQAWLPRFGLTYGLLPQLNVYATFNQGYEPVEANTNVNELSGGPFDPLYSRLYETGLKSELFGNRLLATLSVFDLTNNNVLVSANDSDNINLLEQRGQERSSGVELEAAGRITDGLSVQLNYAFIDARITESDDPAENGLQKEQAPRHSSGSWIAYDAGQLSPFLNGFRLSAGHRHVSRRRTFDTFSATGDWLYISSYIVFDTALRYQAKQFSISAKLNNVLDKTYWEGAYGFQRNFVGQPRNLMLRVSYTF